MVFLSHQPSPSQIYSGKCLQGNLRPHFSHNGFLLSNPQKHPIAIHRVLFSRPTTGWMFSSDGNIFLDTTAPKRMSTSASLGCWLCPQTGYNGHSGLLMQSPVPRMHSALVYTYIPNTIITQHKVSFSYESSLNTLNTIKSLNSWCILNGECTVQS